MTRKTHQFLFSLFNYFIRGPSEETEDVDRNRIKEEEEV